MEPTHAGDVLASIAAQRGIALEELAVQLRDDGIKPATRRRAARVSFCLATS